MRGGLFKRGSRPIAADKVPYPWAREELEFVEPVARGARGPLARLVQEYLEINGEAVVIDGEFGPATERALRRFQKRMGLRMSGTVNAATHAALTRPLREGLGPAQGGRLGLARTALALARRYRDLGAREVGAMVHAGPWVRLFMHGREGPSEPWNAGFVATCLRQAADLLHSEPPILLSASPGRLAEEARGRGLFVPEQEIANPAVRPALLHPGALFLMRNAQGAFIHVGFVAEAGREEFTTIEAAPPDPGTPPLVLTLTRAYRGRDFIVLEDG